VSSALTKGLIIHEGGRDWVGPLRACNRRFKRDCALFRWRLGCWAVPTCSFKLGPSLRWVPIGLPPVVADGPKRALRLPRPSRLPCLTLLLGQHRDPTARTEGCNWAYWINPQRRLGAATPKLAPQSAPVFAPFRTRGQGMARPNMAHRRSRTIGVFTQPLAVLWIGRFFAVLSSLILSRGSAAGFRGQLATESRVRLNCR
jgi:hypothetical protein